MKALLKKAAMKESEATKILEDEQQPPRPSGSKGKKTIFVIN
jgi:hypothetical protein